MMGIKKFLSHFTAREIIFLFIVSLTPLLWFFPGQVIMGHDSGFRLNFFSYYKSLLFAFDPWFNFGRDWQLYKGFLLTQFPEFLFSTITGSWEIGQRLMMHLWFFLMGISMYCFVRELAPKKEQWIWRVSSSVFFMFNFYILQGWFIVERAKFSLYVAIPIVALLLFCVFIKKKSMLIHAVLFGLTYFFLSGGGSPPLYGATFILWGMGFLFFTLYRMKYDGIKKGLFFGIKAGILFFVFFLLMNSYWIVPQIGLYLSTYSSAVAERGGVEGLIAWERVNSKNASFINLLRLQGVPDWYDNPSHPFSSVFLTNWIFILGSFVPMLTVFSGMVHFFLKKEKEKDVFAVIIFILCLFFIGLLFSSGSHPPFGIFYEYAMRHVPGFAIFRSSFYKFGPLLWFSMIVLFGYFSQRYVFLIKNKKIQTGIGICLIFGILVYHFPFFQGNIFQFHKEFTTRVHPPSYVKDMAMYVNANTKPSDRILILPELSSGYYNVQMDAYTWGFFSLDILPRNSFDRSIIANDNNAPEVVGRIYTEMMNGEKQTFVKLLKEMGISYILWRNDAKYSETITTGRTRVFQREKLEAFQFPLVHTVGEWELYSIGDVSVPLVSIPEIVTFGKDIKSPLDYLLSFEDQKRRGILEGMSSISPSFIELECITCAIGEFEKMVKDTSIPTLRFEPGTPFFVRMLKKEEEALEKAGDVSSQIFDAHIAKATLRLSLIEYYANHKNDVQKEQALQEYEHAMGISLESLMKLSEREYAVYTRRLYLFLFVHAAYLEKFGLTSTVLQTIRETIEPYVFMTRDQGDIFYESTISEDGIYELSVIGRGKIYPSFVVDGKSVGSGKEIMLQKGFHQIRMIRGREQYVSSPIIFLKIKKNEYASKYASLSFDIQNPTHITASLEGVKSPFVLELNQTFDPRWKAYNIKYPIIKSSNNPIIQLKTNIQIFFIENFPSIMGEEIGSHVKVNGYANGWWIEKTGDMTIILSYTPQYLFYIGLIGTALGIGSAIGVLLFCRKECTQ